MAKGPYDKQFFVDLFAAKPASVDRALIVLAARQTPDERAMGSTHVENARGFNKVDAEILTSLAEWVRLGRQLSFKQRNIAVRKLPKYWRQLAEEAEAKAAGRAATSSVSHRPATTLAEIARNDPERYGRILARQHDDEEEALLEAEYEATRGERRQWHQGL